jgi:hypothetical protein
MLKLKQRKLRMVKRSKREKEQFDFNKINLHACNTKMDLLNLLDQDYTTKEIN